MTLFDHGWQFTEVTGFGVSEFALLFNRFGDILARTCLDDPSETKSVLGRPRSLDPRSQLLLFLLWIRQYPVERLLAWMFNLDIKQVYQYNWASWYVLYNYYNKQLVCQISSLDINMELHFERFLSLLLEMEQNNRYWGLGTMICLCRLTPKVAKFSEKFQITKQLLIHVQSSKM